MQISLGSIRFNADYVSQVTENVKKTRISSNRLVSLKKTYGLFKAKWIEQRETLIIEKWESFRAFIFWNWQNIFFIIWAGNKISWNLFKSSLWSNWSWNSLNKLSNWLL